MNSFRKIISRPLPALLLAAVAAAALPADIAAAADGCPAGTIGFADIGGTRSVLLSAFTVDAGGANPDTATMTCNFQVYDANGGYNLYAADYRGFAHLEDGQTATFTDPNGDPAAFGTTGPVDDNVFFEQVIATGPNEALIMDVTVELDAAGGGPAQFQFDTADYTRFAFTTQASVESSMAAIANSIATAIGQLRGTAEYLLLGGNSPFDAPGGIGVVAATGSSLIGITGRANLTAGLTLLGGAALLSQSAGTIDVGQSALFAGAIRYMAPSRFFVEAGITGAPRLNLAIHRPYQNNGTMTEGVGTTDGRLLSVFGRAGRRIDFGERNLVLAATVAHNILQIGAYSEPMTMANPFAASFAAARYATTSLSAGFAWTIPLAPTLDVTLAADVGNNFGTMPVGGTVGFIGPVATTATPGPFVNGSARLGFRPTERLSLDAFVLGMMTASSPAELQIGGAVRVTF